MVGHGEKPHKKSQHQLFNQQTKISEIPDTNHIIYTVLNLKTQNINKIQHLQQQLTNIHSQQNEAVSTRSKQNLIEKGETPSKLKLFLMKQNISISNFSWDES